MGGFSSKPPPPAALPTLLQAWTPESAAALLSLAGQTSNGLRLELLENDDVNNKDQRLVFRFHNDLDRELQLLIFPHWRLIVQREADGVLVQPAAGPLLPCGFAEQPTPVPPHGSVDNLRTLACTQPFGAQETIGFSYEHLEPGLYRIHAVFQNPLHNDAVGEQRAVWRGTAVSNALDFRKQ